MTLDRKPLRRLWRRAGPPHPLPERQLGRPIRVLLLLLTLGSAGFLGVFGAEAARAEDYPSWLPRYGVDIDLDLSAHQAQVHLQATWTNPQSVPTTELVFNAHSRYVVPDNEVGFMAKMLEILRLNAGDALGTKDPACDIHRVTLLTLPHSASSGEQPLEPSAPTDLPFRFEGDTKTTLAVTLPRAIGPGESVTVELEFTMHLPRKQGRWGRWEGVTFLSNWLPVFAYYGPKEERKTATSKPGAPAVALPHARSSSSPDAEVCWQPTPFIAWHQPFFNEAGHYHVRVALPCDQKVACTGSVVDSAPLPDGRRQLTIEAAGVRDFALLCSARYQPWEATVVVAPDRPPVRVHVLAFPEHEYYAQEMLRISTEALTAYSRWFGPYPYPDFTLVESYFGWNGNECATLVMIDERVFSMPHLACNFVEYLVSHEICHQWWYNQVGTNGYCETWMDEAMATHFAHRLMDEKFGKNNVLMRYPQGLEWLPNIHREDYRSYGLYGTLGRGENTPVVQEMPKFEHIVNLFSMCYDKGSRIVGMIEARLGSTAFLDFSRHVVTRYRYRILRVADYQHELEAYTGSSWEEFFQYWLYGTGLTDWCIEKVEVEPPAVGAVRHTGALSEAASGNLSGVQRSDRTRVTVFLHQKEEYSEQTVLGFALPDCPGFAVRIPILPQSQLYRMEDPPALVEPLGDNRFRVEVLLPEAPTQIAVDPDQILVDRDPSNNFWKKPVRWRVTPLYTFLEETDLTNAYDRWNVIVGPWIYGTAYNDAWYTRSTMAGFRVGAYRTQDFSGGAYAAYRTDFRDVVTGVDGFWDHWPDSHFQVGFNAERRLTEFYHGNDNAFRGVVWGRYIFQYGSSLYLPPMHYIETFGAYQDNFLPYNNNPTLTGERFDRTSTVGLHYRINYLTPYWDPEGGFQFDAYYEGGVADLPEHVGLNKFSSQFAMVKSLPDWSRHVEGLPLLGGALGPTLRWLGDTRLAVRAYGATSLPIRGEFFTMGGGELFRGFDLAQRQGSTVWVGSVEWRVPLAQNLALDACDHIMGLRNVYGAFFYDVGDAYTSNRSVGPVAHAVGAGLRLDMAWFGFVERTMLRLDVAKAINDDAPLQVWFGVQHPF